MYPYSTSTKIDYEGNITLNLPKVQDYAPNSFGLNANTMVAVTGGTDDYFLPFKNVCGYLGLKLYGNHTIKQISLTGKNGEKIAGKAVVKASHTEVPSLTMDQTTAASDSIYLNCSEGVQLSTSATEPTIFWFVVPPTTFENGFTVTATTTEGRVFRHQSIKSQTISRNVCKMMPAFEVKTDASAPVIVSATLDKNPVDVTDSDQKVRGRF